MADRQESVERRVGCDRFRIWSVLATMSLLILIPVYSSFGQEDSKKPATKSGPAVKAEVGDQERPKPKRGVEYEGEEGTAPSPKVVPPLPRLSEEQLAQIRSLRSPIRRLARVPNMFGDLFNQSGQLVVNGAFGARADIPTAGVLGRSKVSENNKAVTMDRFYFTFNHFHNALEGDIDTLDNLPATDLSVTRYTLGMERRFLDELWSVDLRLPLVARYDFGIPKFGVTGDEIGNLSVILKRQLVATCTTGVVAGLGIDIPTGGDLNGHAGGTSFTLHNDAVTLSPYVGMLYAPESGFFYHGFVQLDVPLNGNRIEFADPFFATNGRFGRISEQTLMHFDAGIGRWVYRNCCAPVVTGLAAVLELHYTTTLDDADIVYGSVSPLRFQFGNTLNRIDAVQLTCGLHVQLGAQTTLRVGGAFPLNSGPERPFDAEVLVSLNRYY